MNRTHLFTAALVFGASALLMILTSGSLAGALVLLGPFCGLLGEESNDGSWEYVRVVFAEIGHYLLLGVIAQFVIRRTEAGNFLRHLIWGLTCLVWVIGSFVAMFARIG